MAHTPGTPARVQRLSSLVAIVAVAVAIALAFGRIFAGLRRRRWRLLGGRRRLGRDRLGDRAAGHAARHARAAPPDSCWRSTWLAAPQTTWFGLPTAETLRTLGSLATQVGGPGARLRLPRSRHARADPCRHDRRVGRGVLVLRARVPRPEPAARPDPAARPRRVRRQRARGSRPADLRRVVPRWRRSPCCSRTRCAASRAGGRSGRRPRPAIDCSRRPGGTPDGSG